MPGSPKRRPRSDKRTRIVDAAIEVFAAKGFHSARISDIARLAGVADGTIGENGDIGSSSADVDEANTKLPLVFC